MKPGGLKAFIFEEFSFYQVLNSVETILGFLLIVTRSDIPLNVVVVFPVLNFRVAAQSSWNCLVE